MPRSWIEHSESRERKPGHMSVQLFNALAYSLYYSNFKREFGEALENHLKDIINCKNIS
jgi:hypothetical protein